MLDIFFLLLALWCHYTLMRRAAALVRFHTLGGLFAGRRANGTADAWDVDCGWCLVIDRMRCGVLGVVICLFWPSCRLFRCDRMFRGKGHRRLLFSLQGWMLGNTEELRGRFAVLPNQAQIPLVRAPQGGRCGRRTNVSQSQSCDLASRFKIDDCLHSAVTPQPTNQSTPKPQQWPPLLHHPNGSSTSTPPRPPNHVAAAHSPTPQASPQPAPSNTPNPPKAAKP